MSYNGPQGEGLLYDHHLPRDHQRVHRHQGLLLGTRARISMSPPRHTITSVAGPTQHRPK